MINAIAILLGLLVVAVLTVSLLVQLCPLRDPDFIIGKPGSPYIRRWWVIPRNRIFNIYLHEILRSDDDRALHDHPWFNVSIVLEGEYVEVMPLSRPSQAYPCPPEYQVIRPTGSVVFRRPTQAHRLVLAAGERCRSLFITGPNVRDWGFWCPRGWKHWREFVAPGNAGEIGPGCGEG